MSYAVVQGDLEPDMLLTLRVNGVAEDISDQLDLLLIIKKPNGVVIGKALTAVDLANGQVKRVWSAGDNDLAGRYYGQVRVQRANGEYQTWPNKLECFQWEVIPSLDFTIASTP
jgi:hypothetical protein